MELFSRIQSHSNNLWPEPFAFYDQGTVQPLIQSPTLLQNELMIDFDKGPWNRSQLVLFKIFGDTLSEELVAIVRFEDGLDPSTYLEVGNIIISRLAGSLKQAEQNSEDLFISPPQNLTTAQAKRILTSGSSFAPILKTYLHSHEDKETRIDFILMPVVRSRRPRKDV